MLTAFLRHPRFAVRFALAGFAAGASLPAQPKAKSTPADAAPATPVDQLVVPAGFKVELLYTVPKADQGSWVAVTVDPRGRLIVADQYGSLYRLSPPPLGKTGPTAVERLSIDLTSQPFRGKPPEPGTKKSEMSNTVAVGAHGLLYAFDSLYFMVNENRGRTGLWRARDTNGDDQFDELKLVREMIGSGEHGTHAVVLSPDGRSLYFANGNHTDLPIGMEKARPVAWGEDHLIPRMWDARGHAKDKYAPGGYIGRMDPEGRAVELFALGFRNQYDIAFDQNGELFTYDSDMEWDIGSPWYVPTRINHVVDGGDYGWRSGAGRWPAYYADSLPAVVDIGPGSPTGVGFGTGARFPARHQRALYAADWTYGTLYAVHMTPAGASFRAELEEFVTGKPLPLTDMVVNPQDGAFYFTTGGRRTQSALYRVTYTGSEATAPVGALPPTPEAVQRRKLEALHGDDVNPAHVTEAWPFLSHPDRFLRFAARVAIEKQPVGSWQERALTESQPTAAVEALIALARRGDPALRPRVIGALERLSFAALPAEQRLPYLRAWHLAFTRLGQPDAATQARLAARFEPLFPAADALENRELVALLVSLQSTQVVARTVPLLSVSERAIAEPGSASLIARNDHYASAVSAAAASRPDRQQIAYAYALRHAKTGWTPALRREYFGWFSRTRSWRGGASFAGFIQNIRTESLAQVPAGVERVALDALSKPAPPSFATAAVTPQGPGRAYTLADAVTVVPATLSGRDFNRGKAMFTATACVLCHRFGEDGGGIGPDLTGAGSRYTVRDLLQAIIEPSHVISDQYGSEQIDLTDGSTLVGRVVGEANGELQVMANPFVPDDKTLVKVASVKSRQTYPVSLMPPGLINGLNEEELKDLVAYLLSGGNPKAATFKPVAK